MSSRSSIVVHGHFYQPPRENPWTGVVDREPNAAPDHDWNARITRECYAPLASIPIGTEPDPPRLNAYNFLSFDVGPTLLTWLERESPHTYGAMLHGDRLSMDRLGHGNAIAAPYHHIILPLSSRRDKRIEVRWGIQDFRRRFGREPIGMWLPETAVDMESLEVLAEEGIRFTILAPHQVKTPPADGTPGLIKVGSREIAVFAYDGPLSHDVAFGAVLGDAAVWEKRMLEEPAKKVVSLATDGETFGHHHRFGDLALGALLNTLVRRRTPRLENYASALHSHPPHAHLELVEPTSWSCVHGIERWRSDCGCRMETKGVTNQKWRKPLREAIDWLVREAGALFERAGAARDKDPWKVLDTSGIVGPPAGTDSELVRLVDMERNALRSLTSCGWFFDDFAGLEGRQVLRYAARAISLAGSEGPRLEAGFLERLAPAESNDPKVGSARAFYLALARSDRPA